MQEKRNVQTIMVHSYKGGTGKTSISINLARYLSKTQKMKVLLIEQDSRGPSFVNIFRITPETYWNDFYSSSDFTLSNLITKRDDFDVVCAKEGGIEIPVGEDANHFYNRQLQRLKRLKLWLKREKYDYVIFDTAPGYSRELINNLLLVDIVVLITRLDTDTVTKTIEMYENIYKHFKDRRIVLVQNQVPLTHFELEKMDLDVQESLTKWNKFVTNKTLISIPLQFEIARALFVSKIISFDNPFMEYISQIAEYITTL